MRKLHRLRLLYLLLRPSFPNPTGFAFPCCRLYYLTLSKPSHPHHKSTNRNTPTTTATPIASLDRSSFILISLWWRWRESNPRPTCLRFEGITTILYAALTLLDPVAASPQLALSPALQTLIPLAYTLELASTIVAFA